MDHTHKSLQLQQPAQSSFNRDSVARWSIGKRAALASAFALSMTLIGLYDLQHRWQYSAHGPAHDAAQAKGAADTAHDSVADSAPDSASDSAHKSTLDSATPSGTGTSAPSESPLQGLQAVPQDVRADEPALHSSPTEDLRTYKVDRGDTLMAVLTKLGAEDSEAHAAVGAIRSHFNPRDLRIGQILTAAFTADESGQQSKLVRLALEQDVERTIVASLDDAGIFVSHEELTPLNSTPVRRSGVITSSLYEAMKAEGVPDRVIVSLIRVMSYDVDFQRDIRQGDRFDVLYDVLTDENGTLVKAGAMHFASLTNGSKTTALYRHELVSGQVGYYTADGKASKKLLMRTPIDGARISSGYGMRKHPVLGYSKMHKGVDFAAARGTPIMAAGNGTIEYAGWRGTYGIYAKIKHTDGFETAYAHMKSLAKGVRKGSHVRQGQIIGYVGNTGRATGPHLHYEVIKAGKVVNPGALSFTTSEKLSREEFARFAKTRVKTESVLAALPARKSAHFAAAAGQ